MQISCKECGFLSFIPVAGIAAQLVNRATIKIAQLSSPLNAP